MLPRTGKRSICARQKTDDEQTQYRAYASIDAVKRVPVPSKGGMVGACLPQSVLATESLWPRLLGGNPVGHLPTTAGKKLTILMRLFSTQSLSVRVFGCG
jgi:hypothetical protein